MDIVASPCKDLARSIFHFFKWTFLFSSRGGIPRWAQVAKRGAKVAKQTKKNTKENDINKKEYIMKRYIHLQQNHFGPKYCTCK
jgi:hypothetical protein